jgi:ATP-binding protein involved in chromosome partitioning
MSKVKEILETIKNPATGATLGEEKRISKVDFKGIDLYIEYDREGISPQHKRDIEDAIISSLEGHFKEDNIYIMTSSKASSDVMKSVGQSAPKESNNPATLNVGHGKPGEKKPIQGIKHVVAIGSGKGGVGKSTFTSNLACTLANQGHKVGVIDADIYGPSMPMLMNMRDAKPEATEDKKIIPLESYGVKFISFGSFIQEGEPVIWRGPMLGGILNQFLFDTDWGELDYLLVDLPPGTGDIQLSMIQNVHVDGSIIISTPQDVALLDATKGANMFHKLNLPVIGMVENMSSFICDDCGKEHFIFGTGGVQSACGNLGLGYLGQIPLEMGLRKGADFGKPYMMQQNYEGTKVWKAYQDISQRIDSYFHPGENKKKSLLSKILKN